MTDSLKPRKTPVQARSAATVAALHTATIQVLTREGLSRCTTTRVASRAGISVGSLYQYYPNRDVLLVAVLEQHLNEVASAVEAACQKACNQPVADMASALVTAFLTAKLRDPQESKALYAVAGEQDGARLVAMMHERLVTAVAEMLASATDADFANSGVTATIALGALVGPVRTLLEGLAEPGFEACLAKQLTLLLQGYLQATSRVLTSG
ncbi:TetR/AcrR family transcriptional regulator [Enterobacteriaceae bacterium H18W14]|uniref:TetR/AcrR family transcriptional regulator n=1 Tax=Dryocola boscaweniae TaxID=2925397 RepID=UPI0022F09BA5|nr:TetR/AcrR family transcriptional regulator [Dryocola boscaweniae]MCT4715030.1 TetR/AcrR family transcriptional regulator [Dryocola boscaweniae]